MSTTIVSPPTRSLCRALRMTEGAEVDYEAAVREHREFSHALSELGFVVSMIDPDERYPDGVFTEDPCVILEDSEGDRHALVVARLNRKERQGEEERLRKHLMPTFFSSSHSIEPPGYLEGGDVLVAPQIRQLFVGISARTNEYGAEQLARLGRDLLGYRTTYLPIPKSFLHLKGETTFHARASGRHQISVSEEIAGYFVDTQCELLVTPQSERFGANCISNSSVMLMRSGAPKTRLVFESAGYQVREVPISQFMLVDGALTCLWKRVP